MAEPKREKRDKKFWDGSALVAYIPDCKVLLGLHFYCIQQYEIVLQYIVFIEKLWCGK
jgi:hypothetical protein